MSARSGSAPPRKRGPGRPPGSDSADTRAHILRAAAESFAAGGFGDTPVSVVAAMADVTTGLLYYYFGSKSGLFEAVGSQERARLNERVIDPILTLTAPQAALEARLTMLVNVLAHRGGEDLNLHALALASDLEAGRSAVVRAFRDSVQHDLSRLYAAMAGIEVGQPVDEQQAELVAFVELMTLGMWFFAVRPHGLERLPILAQALAALVDGTLFDDADETSSVVHGTVSGPSPQAGGVTEGVADRIAAIALRRFATSGYGNTSVKEIATEAGMTTGAVYYHFGSKAGLHRAAGVVGTARLMATYAEAAARLNAQRDQRKRVRILFEVLGAHAYDHIDNHRLGTSVHVDAARYPGVADTRDDWAHDLERFYRIVADGDMTVPRTAEWEQSPVPVLLNALTLGTSWVVVRHGPHKLAVALRGLVAFVD